MDTPTTPIAPPGSQDQAVSFAQLQKKMRDCEPDRIALAKEITPLIQDLFGEALKALESVLPDFREPGSADAKLHSALRSRILNAGNAKIRELPLILQNYLVVQVYERQQVVKVKIPTQGIHDLPAGVTIRGQPPAR